MDVHYLLYKSTLLDRTGRNVRCGIKHLCNCIYVLFSEWRFVILYLGRCFRVGERNFGLLGYHYPVDVILHSVSCFPMQLSCFLDCLASTLLSRSKWNRIPNRNGRTDCKKLLDTKIRLLAANSTLLPFLLLEQVSLCSCRIFSMPPAENLIDVGVFFILMILFRCSVLILSCLLYFPFSFRTLFIYFVSLS